MPKQTLALDVDETIWDFCTAMQYAMQEVCGVTFSYEDKTDWDFYFTLAAREDILKAFSVALDPKKVKERELYPGVVEAIQDLHDSGIRTHFITTNRDPEPIRAALASWLLDVLPVPFGLSVTKTGKKIPIMERVGAFGIVDDHPHFIQDVADAGYLAMSMIHPWNLAVVEARDDVHGFHHWSEFPEALEKAMEAHLMSKLAR